ncbi:MAG TPA: AbiV family abortive infection protein [Streptosporangiaceae bacterium]
MAITKTPLPDAAVLGEFAIVAAENARRLLTDAENLLTRGGWPTAHSLALLALEEAGQVLAVPDRPGYAERAEG